MVAHKDFVILMLTIAIPHPYQKAYTRLEFLCIHPHKKSICEMRMFKSSVHIEGNSESSKIGFIIFGEKRGICNVMLLPLTYSSLHSA
jgi:hypothetical protein